MAPITSGRAPDLLILVGAGLCLLATGSYSVTPQARAPVHPSSPSSHVRTMKRTWRTGPASMLPETEVVPARPSPVPPAVRAQTLSVQGEQKAKRGEELERGRPAGSTLAAMRTTAAPLKSVVTTNNESRRDSGYVDPEKRALDELNRLRANPGARQAFYDDLRHTVEQIHAGGKDENAKKPATYRP